MKLYLRFKGDRSYVHGTDLFDESTRVCKRRYGAGHVIGIELKSFARYGVKLVAESRDDFEGSLLGRCIFSVRDSKPITLSLVEDGRAITDRVSYKEEEIIHSAVFDVKNQSAYAPISAIATRIEQIVAMNKELHARLWPQPPGHWVFTRLRLIDDIDSQCKRISIEIKRSVANRFTEAEIKYDQQLIGKITFTVAL